MVNTMCSEHNYLQLLGCDLFGSREGIMAPGSSSSSHRVWAKKILNVDALPLGLLGGNRN